MKAKATLQPNEMEKVSAALRAANQAFISMEGRYPLGVGPRTAAAAQDHAINLYPALAPAAETFATAALTANCRQ